MTTGYAQSETLLERCANRLVDAAGTSSSRGRFLGGIAVAAVALTTKELLAPGIAGAHLEPPHINCADCNPGTNNCWGSRPSIFCSLLPGHFQNSCPPGTVGCGSWLQGTCANGQVLRYADCCGDCNNGNACQNLSNGVTCCRHMSHTNGAAGTDCGAYHIKCIRSFCS